jgi:hypothetical protein
MNTIRDHFLHSELPLETIAKIAPFVAAHRPHWKPIYSEVDYNTRMAELHYAHQCGEWRHPACGEDDKAMDVIQEQHTPFDVTNRSYHWVSDWDSEPTDDGW